MATLAGYGMNPINLDFIPGRKRLGQAKVTSCSGNMISLYDAQSFLFINTSVFGVLGDSGGGVFDSSSNRLIGIMFSGNNEHYTYAHNLCNSNIRDAINNIMKQAYEKDKVRLYNTLLKVQ